MCPLVPSSGTACLPGRDLIDILLSFIFILMLSLKTPSVLHSIRLALGLVPDYASLPPKRVHIYLKACTSSSSVYEKN